MCPGGAAERPAPRLGLAVEGCNPRDRFQRGPADAALAERLAQIRQLDECLRHPRMFESLGSTELEESVGIRGEVGEAGTSSSGRLGLEEADGK